LNEKIIPEDRFLEIVEEKEPIRIPGTAVFMDSNPKGTPQALLHNLEHNKVLHERVVLLTLITSHKPYVSDEERFDIREIGENTFRINANIGFAEDADVPKLLGECKIGGDTFDIEEMTFFLGRETMLATKKPGMALWREKLFARMSRNAQRAASYFNIPSERVVEIGTQIEL